MNERKLDHWIDGGKARDGHDSIQPGWLC